MDEYIKRSEVVGLIEDKFKRCETVYEALDLASLRTAVMGLRSTSVAPMAEWISVEELDMIIDWCREKIVYAKRTRRMNSKTFYGYEIAMKAVMSYLHSLKKAKADDEQR